MRLLAWAGPDNAQDYRNETRVLRSCGGPAVSYMEHPTRYYWRKVVPRVPAPLTSAPFIIYFSHCGRSHPSLSCQKPRSPDLFPYYRII